MGSKSLNNLISPDSEDCHTPNKPQKRKILETNCEDLSLLAKSKKTRTHIFTDDKQILNNGHNGEESNKSSSNVLHGGHQHNSARTADCSGQSEAMDAADRDVAAAGPAAADVPGAGGVSSPSKGGTSGFGATCKRTFSFCQTSCVQWRNTNALCWLDSILSALVHLEALKNTVTELCSKDSVFWRLFEKYNQANKLLYTSQLDEVKGWY